MKKQPLRLRLENDPPEMTEAIDAAVNSNLAVRRVSPFQIKTGRVNFWPSTGRVVVDGEEKIHREGLETFIMLAQGREKPPDFTISLVSLK